MEICLARHLLRTGCWLSSIFHNATVFMSSSGEIDCVGCGWGVGGVWVGCGWGVGGVWVGCGWGVGGVWVGCG